MDQFGKLHLNWSVGYDGSPVHFIDDNTICYLNGNCVKFINIEDGSTKYLQSPGNGISNLAVNPLYGYIAFSENGLNSRVFIYDYNTNLDAPIKVLSGTCESVGFTCIAFANNGSLLATCSDVPETTLTLWNWPDGVEYCTYPLKNNSINKIIFNPNDWRQFCCISEKTVLVWNIEKVNESYYLQKKKVILPTKDGTFGLEFVEGDSIGGLSNRPTTGHATVQLTQTAIAGLFGNGKERFLEEHEKYRCEAKSFCWEPNNQLLIACTDGILLRFDVENNNITLIKHQDEENKRCYSFTNIQLHQDGLFTSDNTGHVYHLTLTKQGYKINKRTDVEQEISHLQFSPDYSTLIVACTTGYIYRYKEQNILPIIEDGRDGEIIGIGNICANNQHLVVGRSEGLVTIYTTADGKSIGKINLDIKLTCLACPPSSSAVFLGTQHGSIVIVDLTNPSSPRCVMEKRIHNGPITFMKTDDTGTIIMTSSMDNHLFLCDATVSSGLNILGYTEISGDVVCMSIRSLHETQSNGPWKAVVGLATSEHKPGCNQLIELKFDQDLWKGASTLYMNDTKLLKDISVNKKVFVLKTFVYDVALVTENVVFGIVHNGNRIAKFNLAEHQETASTSTNTVLDAAFTYAGHAIPGGRINLSCHAKWLVTSSSDGHVMLRAVGAMNNIVSLQAGDYRSGGIQFVRFTADAQQVLSVSKTGVVSNWKWNYSALGKSKATVAIETYKSKLGEIRDVKNKEDAYMKNMENISPKNEGHDSTWLELAVANSRKKEDEKYKTTKTSLKAEIMKLREQVLHMMTDNEKLTDIEKLDRFEFNMDIEERNALLAEREKMLKELRAETELKDTAKQYLWSLVKTECWGDMVTKGRNILGFHSNIEVSNYPMKEKSAEGVEKLDYVTQLRQIEEIEAASRKSIFQPEIASYPSLIEKLEEGDEDVTETTRALKSESPATYGSLGFAYGGQHESLQSQFKLHTKNQKRSQIVLLEESVYKIKQQFNKVFDEIYNAKMQEIKRINERNIRIKKILNDLSTSEPLITMEISTLEQPELLFTVDDSEITVEKYISEEERQRLEELARLEEERRLAENADNLRGRALEMMMAGRLETGLEDELKKEIEVPEFMEKPQEKWTEEEQKLAKEYERKKAQLTEEREKFRRSLEMELKKLQATNVEATNAFDERLSQLFQKRVKTEAVILQEELKIVRLVASILINEELEAGEIELLNTLETKKDEKQQSSLSVGDVRRAVEEFRDSYEMLLADDKTLDKMFRKEFSDLDAHTIDVLYRLFKKRPRAQRTLKAAVENQGDTTADKGNPFQVRPSSSRAVSANAANLERAMAELDSEQHMPENVEMETWQHLIYLRRNKVEKEQQLKSNALILADMSSFLQKKLDYDDELKLQVEKVFEEIQRLRDERLRFNLNLEVQLLLKQGQIEVGKCDFVFDYTDSLLIHRSAVEDLNAIIKTLGESKLASMRESKEFRKGIHILAWQLKEMFMKAEDLQSAAQDLQLLRVTKDLQSYLSETDQRQSKQQEIGTLEKTIEAYNEMHNRKVNDKKRIIRKLKRQIREKTEENSRLDQELEEMALDVAERSHINRTKEKEDKSSPKEQIMRNIITRRKLVDLAKTQASQIGVLRAEVERLRMRTFPALVQLHS